MISRRDISATNAVDGRTLTGIAAVYGQRSRELREGGRTFTEVISRGAFGDLHGRDVKLYYNHDSSMPLARTRSGTLELRDTAEGLAYTATMPDTSRANDVLELLRRGDLSGEMSFGFIVRRDEWNARKTERTVHEATLIEISMVVDAAYPQTTTTVRNLDERFLEALKGRLTLHKNRMEQWKT